MKGYFNRRDWCIQSKDSGRYVLDQILSGNEKEVVIKNIHEHLEEAKRMRGGELPQDKYAITKVLNKHPNDYVPGFQVPGPGLRRPDDAQGLQGHEYGRSHPLRHHRAREGRQKTAAGAPGPDEIARSDGALTPDVEWYLTQQILPPISLLCEPIEGTSHQIVAEKLGLDSSKYKPASVSVNVDEEDMMEYTPASCLPDEERFKDVEMFAMACVGCNVESELPGVFRLAMDADTGVAFCQSGLHCPNPECRRPDNWGKSDPWSCVSKILNNTNLTKKQKQKLYYDGLVRCDDPMYNL